MAKVRTKLRQSARGRDCTLRLPGCPGDPSTVVLCHLPGGGMAAKVPDTAAVYGCHHCHDVIDRRGGDWREIGRDLVNAALVRALVETHRIMEGEGLL